MARSGWRCADSLEPFATPNNEGRPMRVVSCMFVLALLCLTVSGCSLFKKNNTGGTAGSPTSGGTPPPKWPVAQDPLLNSNIQPPPAFPATSSHPHNTSAVPASASSHTTILAGTVTDAFHRPIGNVYIRPVNLEEKETGAPIDVVADASGHFIIQGVKPGASYKLIARTKQGDKMLAGTVLTSAPNVRVLIPIREDLNTASTPPLPGSPAYQNSKNAISTDPNPFGTAWNAAHNNSAAPAVSPVPVKDPLLGFGNRSGSEPNLPATMNVTAPPTNSPVANPSTGVDNPAFVPGIVDNMKDKERLPILNIPPLKTRPAPTPFAPGDSKLDTGPTRIPSCVLIGSHLENLALRDTRGQNWEYRKQGQGRLVLIEFWNTSCLPCRDTMPTLNRLHTQYGPRGLEVLGIALETGKDERKEAEVVSKMCSSMQISYRQLIGRVGTFDAGKHFKIESVPTLLLVSESGDIIWHHVGRPDPALLSALERTIQNRLNNRPF